MSGNVIFLGKKIFEIPPFFQTRPGDLGKTVHACSLHFSALKRMGGLKTKSTSSLAFYPRPLLISLRCSIFFSSRSSWEPFHSLVSVIHKHCHPSQSGCQETKNALTSLLMTSRQTPTTLDSNQCRMHYHVLFRKRDVFIHHLRNNVYYR